MMKIHWFTHYITKNKKTGNPLIINISKNKPKNKHVRLMIRLKKIKYKVWYVNTPSLNSRTCSKIYRGDI